MEQEPSTAPPTHRCRKNRGRLLGRGEKPEKVRREGEPGAGREAGLSLREEGEGTAGGRRCMGRGLGAAGRNEGF